MEGLIKCVSWIPVFRNEGPLAKLLTHEKNSRQEELLKAVVTCQCAWRRWLARRKLKMLKLAAREEISSKETICKLEKEVEDLERQLQSERRLRTDLELTTTHDIALLQEALYELQLEIEESDAMLDKDMENIGVLTGEIESLKEMLQLEKLSTVAAMKTYAELEDMIAELVLQEKEFADKSIQIYTEAQEKNCGLVKKLQDAEERVLQLQDSVKSLEEKLLRLETEKYRLHCGTLEVQKPSDFHHIIQKISSVVEANEDKDLLCYWLSNSSMLLMLLQCTVRATEAANSNSQRQKAPASLLGKLFSGLQFSNENKDLSNRRVFGEVDEIFQADDEYPTSVFKEQLAVFIEKVYARIRDNIKSEIYPLLEQFTQAPNFFLGDLLKESPTPWQKIVKILQDYLSTMRSNYVPPFLVRKMFAQIFSFISARLFSSLLSQREACTSTNGEFLKVGLAELEKWTTDATQIYASGVMDELKYLRQATAFLVVDQNQKRFLDKSTSALSAQQFSRMNTIAKGGYYRSESREGSSKKSPNRSESREGSSKKSPKRDDSKKKRMFLDDDTSIPFSLEDISNPRA